MKQEIDGRELVRQEAKWYAIGTLFEQPVSWLVAAALSLGVLFFGRRRRQREKE